jgi:hypothetical protein
VLELEEAGTAGGIRCDGEMGPVTENLSCQSCQDIARPDLNEDTGTCTIHRRYFVGKLDGLHQVLGEQRGDSFRIVGVGPRGRVGENLSSGHLEVDGREHTGQAIPRRSDDGRMERAGDCEGASLNPLLP